MRSVQYRTQEEHFAHVVKPRHEPARERIVAVDRLGVTESLQDRVGVVPKCLVEGRQLNSRRDRSFVGICGVHGCLECCRGHVRFLSLQVSVRRKFMRLWPLRIAIGVLIGVTLSHAQHREWVYRRRDATTPLF
jgi:hypothetical protein